MFQLKPTDLTLTIGNSILCDENACSTTISSGKYYFVQKKPEKVENNIRDDNNNVDASLMFRCFLIILSHVLTITF